ncbi:MAG: 16S rRNA (guanine(527)-N(7))-methyltransferase RsmG [Magnetococcales bacterium]|nr:16S rRNA (guanine(527)-N(7))-methyltransferase RsmG [Magnetococcales bacterium]
MNHTYSPTDWHRCFQAMEPLLGHPPNTKQQKQLQQFATHLLTWNQQFNLIGPAAATNLLDRHILDSLTLMPMLPPGTKIADMGSGAGFPGLILAILSDASRTFHLYEATQKKAGFLNFVATELELNKHVTIFPTRVEQSPHPRIYDIVTSRAVAELNTLAKLAYSLLRPDGISLALKGKNAVTEIERFLQSPLARRFTTPRITTAGDGLIIHMQKVSRETRPTAP